MLPLAGIEFITSARSLYDSRTKTLFVCCNLLDTETELPPPSALFAITEDGTATRVPLQHAIKSVAAVRQDATGVLYTAGETGTAEYSTAVIVTVDAAQNRQNVPHTGGAPYAYIADMQLNEKSGELIIAGTEKAADSSGNGGAPFFKAAPFLPVKNCGRRSIGIKCMNFYHFLYPVSITVLLHSLLLSTKTANTPRLFVPPASAQRERRESESFLIISLIFERCFIFLWYKEKLT